MRGVRVGRVAEVGGRGPGVENGAQGRLPHLVCLQLCAARPCSSPQASMRGGRKTRPHYEEQVNAPAGECFFRTQRRDKDTGAAVRLAHLARRRTRVTPCGSAAVCCRTATHPPPRVLPRCQLMVATATTVPSQPHARARGSRTGAKPFPPLALCDRALPTVRCLHLLPLSFYPPSSVLSTPPLSLPSCSWHG